MARGPQQSTYVRLLKAGDRFFDLTDKSIIRTVAEDAVVDEDGMVSVLLAGHTRPSTFDWKDRVRLY
jgi:hypothetical protein